jgi:oxygen-dependent protoporphyrinogen oxidase
MNELFDSIVLGGGISGLTVGFLLQRKGFKVLLAERASRPGGCISTLKKNGFLFELGPNTVLNNAFEIDALCEAAGILGERLAAFPAAKKRFIVKGGRLLPLPGGPLGFIGTPLFSAKAKLRLLKEPFIKRAASGEEESIARFVRRRLGQEMLDYAVGPFVSGVYAGDPERLSVVHATAKIHALEQTYGSLIRGALAKRKGPAPAGGLFSFPGGLQALPDALAKSLGEGYLGETAAAAVQRDGGVFRVTLTAKSGDTRVVEARSVVSALPSKAAALALNPLDADFALAVQALPYADVALVCLGFRREDVGHPLDGFGFLAPEVEKRHVLGCLFPSSLFPDRAPEGHVALAAFVGGAVHPERVAEPEDRVVDKVLADLTPLLGLRGDPVLTRVEAWRPAIPQYVVGHGALKEAAARMENANPGLFVSGNLLYGVSVGNCIQNATAVADKAAAFLID